MSDVNLITEGRYANTHVSDGNSDMDDNLKYILSQKDIVEKNNKKIYKKKKIKKRSNSDSVNGSESDGSEQIHPVRELHADELYDHYRDWLFQNGLSGSNSRQQIIKKYISIDSSQRVQIPKFKTGKRKSLVNNPLSIDNDTLWINMGKNHEFKIGDKISLIGLGYVKKIIKTYTTYSILNEDNDKVNIKRYAIDVVRSIDKNVSNFMRFDIGVNMDVDTINSLTSTGYNKELAFFTNDTTNNLKDKEYDISYNDMYVDIDGFKNSDGSTLIGNIPINILNSRHRIYLSPRDTSNQDDPSELGDKVTGITDTRDHGDSDTKSFYIKLPKEFTGTLDNIGSFNISITFRYYGGIPINTINATFPIDNNNLNGFHKVSSVRSSSIGIKLTRNGYYSGFFGGSKIHISEILSIESGYYNPNSYSIDLENAYNNIVEARMISSEFPNSEKVFKDGSTSDFANNKLYWQNMDDGDKVYSITIPSGNYDADTLKGLIESKTYDVIKNTVDDDSVFTNRNYIQVSIETNTDRVEMSSFKEAILDKPIKKVDPNITESTGISSNDELGGTFIITINHVKHGLSVGDEIIISDYNVHLGIPTAKINGTHTISSVVSDDSFNITIKNVNLESVRQNTSGGNGVKVYVPNIFRLRFDYSDTMGKQLGFRNPGNPTSITPYTNKATNYDAYENEIDKDESGNKIVIKNNSLILSGYNYILMECEELNKKSNFNSLGRVKDIFAKINLSGLPGKILYNSFVPTVSQYYDEPIRDLSRLTVNFYTPDGEPFDFNGLDHSYTIEFTMLDEVPEDTGISARLGRIFEINKLLR